MTKQHFETLARLIADRRQDFASNAAHAAFAAATADALAETESRFDRSRFILAAMPRAWVGTTKEAAWERQARKVEGR